MPGRKSVSLLGGLRDRRQHRKRLRVGISAANAATCLLHRRRGGAPRGLDRGRRLTSSAGHPRAFGAIGRSSSAGTRGSGRAEKALRSDNDAPLDRLACETGRRAAQPATTERGVRGRRQDLRSITRSAMAPSNSRADGTFHSIDVRVARKGSRYARARATTRSGRERGALFPYEQPVLALLPPAPPRRRPISS